MPQCLTNICYCLRTLAILMDEEGHFTVPLVIIFLLIKLSIFLYFCVYVCVCKCLFQSLAHFLLDCSQVLGVCFFFLVVVLYVFWIQFLYQIANIFYSVACLFILNIFWRTEVLNFNIAWFIIFLLLILSECLFCLRNFCQPKATKILSYIFFWKFYPFLSFCICF